MSRAPRARSRGLAGPRCSPFRPSRLRLGRGLGLVAVLLCGLAPVSAQDKPGDASPAPAAEAPDLLERSLPLRTALHNDPTLASPLERLVELYRGADRLEELIGVYRTHLQGYPRDRSARIVFVRLLLASGEGEAERELRRAQAALPQDAYLAYLRYQLLHEDDDVRALDYLDQAIQLERRPVRRRTWTQLLVTEAVAQDRRDLALKHLKRFAELLGGSASAHLDAARKMYEAGFYLDVLGELDLARAKAPSPEGGVEVELLAAQAEGELDRHQAAGARLDALLGRLTANYWRRPEILRRRARLIRSAEQRALLIKDAREAWERERTPSKALDLARLLAGFDRHREALEVALAASVARPESGELEQETLLLFDRLRDERGRLEFIEARLERDPARQDMAEMRVRSLFLLGRNQPAQQALEALLAPLSEVERVKRLAETARFLRAQAFPAFASEVFEKAIATDPARLDLRRELAETRLASGQRSAAHAVLRQPLPTQVDVVLFQDFVQLMIREELLSAARVALKQQLALHPDHFELLLSLLEVEGRLGNGRSGRELSERARSLADNQARFRRWLDASLGFYERFWRGDLFFSQEQARYLTPGEWTKERQAELVAFADLCQAQQRSDALSELSQELMKRPGLPGELVLELRRRLVATPVYDEDQLKATQGHLEELLKDDPQRRAEYRARLAILHAGQGRADEAQKLLAELQPGQLRDADLLRGLASVASEANQEDLVLLLLERVTEVDPADREAWERYMLHLGRGGDEARLRGAIHQLLRSGSKLTLASDVRQLLRTHLADSTWRSVASLLSQPREAPRLEALALLDQVERSGDGGLTWIWVAWARAYALGRLERPAAQAEAVADLERALEDFARRREPSAEDAASGEPPPGPTGAGLPTESPPGTPAQAAPERVATAFPELPALILPDGLSASLEAAKALLLAPPPSALPPLRDRAGPVPTLAARWAFESEGRTAIVAVSALSPDRLLVCDAEGTLSALSRQSGKVLWTRPGLAAGVGPHMHQTTRTSGGSTYNTTYREFWPVRIPVTAGDGTFFLPEVGGVSHYSLEGQLLARVSLADKERLQQPAPAAIVIARGERAYVFEPCTGRAAALERASCKLLWLRELPQLRDETRLVEGLVGASLAGGRLFVYGAWCAILDAESGAVRWSFEAERVRRTRVELREKEREPLSLFLGGFSLSAPPPSNPGEDLLDYTRRGASQQTSPRLVAPAVDWAARLDPLRARTGWVLGSRLVLAREDVSIVDLELPLFPRRVQLAGSYLGSYGELLCLAEPGGLHVLDLQQGGQTRKLSLAPLSAPGKSERLNGCLAGPVAYVSGASGIVCLNVATGLRVWFAPWPEGLAPGEDDAMKGSFNYRGQAFQAPGAAEAWSQPLIGLADETSLYLPSEPWRLLALETAPAAPAPPAPGTPGTEGPR